jgi:RNA polymerase sigma-70 factor (ECF subfamily)
MDSISQQIRDGQYRVALAMCALEHGAALGRFCMAVLGDQAEADDALRETLVAAHDAFPSFDDDGVRTWLFGVAHRMCARRLEARGDSAREPGDESDDENLSDDLLKKSRRARPLRRLLSHLQPVERDIVILRYQSGLGYRDIAEIFSVDEQSVRKMASRALLLLREHSRRERDE